MTSTKLEMLIARYEAAIYADEWKASRVNQLGRLVEAAADECDFTEHARLMAIHTAAEQRAIREEERAPKKKPTVLKLRSFR